MLRKFRLSQKKWFSYKKKTCMDFKKIYYEDIREPYPFLVIDKQLSCDSLLGTI